MSTFKLSFILMPIIILAIGCNNAKSKFVNVELVRSINRMSDSTYLGIVTDIKKVSDQTYLLDSKNCRLVILDNLFEVKKSIGSKGRGPGEMIAPRKFCIRNDSVLIFDGANLRFILFSTDGNLGRMINVDDPLIELCSFFSKNDNIYYISPNSNSQYSTYNLRSNLFEEYNKAAKSDIELVDIAYSNNYNIWFSVNKEKTNIDVYNDDDQLIQKKVLPKELFNRLSYKSKNKKSKVLLFTNIYVDNNYLYLFYIDHSDDYQRVFSNKMMRLNITKEGISNLNDYKIIKLPGKWYDSFCVSNNEIIAFNAHTGALEQFKIIGDE